ncbi:MAG: DUF92 domain-containing protein [Thermomicrobiaceae bacterium]
MATSSGIALIAKRRGSLNGSGIVGAILTGTITTAMGGYGRAALLVGFFAGSSLLSSRRRPAEAKRKALEASSKRVDSTPERVAARGAKRDIWQVLANGGVSTLLAAMGDSRSHCFAYTGSLAAVNGDTWATEIGSRLSSQPRHILTFQPAQPGVSGAISLPGTLASVAGGSFIGALAVVTSSFDSAFRGIAARHLLTGLVAGAIGSLADSLIGATMQERRWCDRCQESTENVRHTCGDPTRIVGGVPGLNNDVVNVLCSVSGAMVGVLIERSSRRY